MPIPSVAPLYPHVVDMPDGLNEVFVDQDNRP